MLVIVKFLNERWVGEFVIYLFDDVEGDKVNNVFGNKDVVLFNC